MKRSQVVVGDTYLYGINGKAVRVHILSESPYGGWDARNLETGRLLLITMAQRLLRRVECGQEAPK